MREGHSPSFVHDVDGPHSTPVTTIMHRRLLLLAAFAIVPLAVADTAAQQPTRPSKPPAQRDSTAKPDSTEADSTADEGDERARTFTSGMSFGGLNYEGGRSERATSVVLRWHALPWLSVGTTPTFARSVEPSGVALRQTKTNSGLTDLPVEVSAEHSFDAPLSPSLSFGFGVTFPVGDTASGFGTGSIGSSINLGGGLALSDKLGVHAGVARSLTAFSIQSTFNGTSPESGDAGFSLQASDAVSMSVGVDGDIGQPDAQYGRAASLSGGISVSLPFVNSVSLNASHGISGATPSWSFAIGVGSDFASVGSVTLNGAASRLRRAFGGGTHGLNAAGSKKTPTTRKGH